MKNELKLRIRRITVEYEVKTLSQWKHYLGEDFDGTEDYFDEEVELGLDGLNAIHEYFNESGLPDSESEIKFEWV